MSKATIVVRVHCSTMLPQLALNTKSSVAVYSSNWVVLTGCPNLAT